MSNRREKNLERARAIAGGRRERAIAGSRRERALAVSSDSRRHAREIYEQRRQDSDEGQEATAAARTLTKRASQEQSAFLRFTAAGKKSAAIGASRFAKIFKSRRASSQRKTIRQRSIQNFQAALCRLRSAACLIARVRANFSLKNALLIRFAFERQGCAAVDLILY